MNRSYDPKLVTIVYANRSQDNIEEKPKYNRKSRRYEWNGRGCIMEFKSTTEAAVKIRSQMGFVIPISIEAEHPIILRDSIGFELPKNSCKFFIWEVFRER